MIFSTTFVILVTLVLLALIFDFLNGFHDAANVVATMIASRAMSPRAALALAAVANLVGPLIFGVAVASTVGKELVEPGSVTITVVMAALVSASLWNIVTWWLGIPSSSSHALAGGIIGGAAAYAGFGVLEMAGLTKIAIALFLSPVLGFIIAWISLRLVLYFSRNSSPKINRQFNRAQLVTATGLALAHGTNDAQKTMGIITLGLVTLGFQETFHVPLWVIIASATSIGAGTAFGGWRLIKTLGGKFYRIRPVHSLTSQFASAAIILSASLLGGPVSTTHVVSSAIVGAGAAERRSMVRWGNMTDILVAWVITVPVTLVLAMGCYFVLRLVLGP
jgi:PiT family inorganic phosphate transporter